MARSEIIEENKKIPKVSIIVPVYNVKKYLRKCLDSLVNQTLKDIEIIMVNDGSTDESKEILKEYEKNNKNFMYLEKENGGLSDARNFGMPYAKGEYIAFLDSDDYVENNIYELMYNKAKSEDSDMVECDFLWEYIDENNKYFNEFANEKQKNCEVLDSYKINKQVIDTGKIYNGKKEMLLYARVVAWNKLIKRSLIVEHDIQFPKGLRYEDVEFFYKMLPYYNKVSFVKVPLIHYIQRKSSISNTQNERVAEIFKILSDVIEYYKKENLYDEYKDELEYTCARLLLCSSLFRFVKVADNQIRKKLLEENWKKLNEMFPNWKKNKYIRNEKSGKSMYMRTVNKLTYKIYCMLYRLK